MAQLYLVFVVYLVFFIFFVYNAYFHCFNEYIILQAKTNHDIKAKKLLGICLKSPRFRSNFIRFC